MEVDSYRCGQCKYFGEKCKCIDHSKVHFHRPYFSCDTFTSHHTICSAFEPSEINVCACKDWVALGGFWNWHKLFIEQWHSGKMPKTISLIKATKPKDGREFGDDIWEVPYEDFLRCEIMRDDGIHYTKYKHIEISRKSPTGYKWVDEDDGILLFGGYDDGYRQND